MVSGEHSETTSPVGLSPENPIYPIEIVGTGICVGVGTTVGVGINVGFAVGTDCIVGISFSLPTSITGSAVTK